MRHHDNMFTLGVPTDHFADLNDESADRRPPAQNRGRATAG